MKFTFQQSQPEVFKYFKNVQVAPEINLGLVRLTNGAASLGYADGGKFTSEFPAHMMSHAERLKVDLT